MARYEIPPGFTIGLIASMPRSGTWYSFYFFEFLDVFLSSRSTLNTRLDLEIYHSMNFAKVHVHTICPGFLEAYDGPHREKWDALRFYVPGFNFGYEKFISGNRDVYSPITNPDIRIIYLYRNPLDQAVSFFRHAVNNIDGNKRVFVDRGGEQITLTDERHYLRTVGLEAYIKQYFTFHELSRIRGRNILMMPYERLVRDPGSSFESMLRFVGVDIEDEHKRNAFRRALKASSPESLRNVEAALETSLGRDQTESSESHIRGGGIGKWQQYFDESDVGLVEETFREFGISLKDFELC